MIRNQLAIEEIIERKRLLKGLAKATIPEALNILSIVLPGPLGIIVPAIGNIYLNFKDDQSLQERKDAIEKINSQLENLSNENDRRKVLDEIEKACVSYLDRINKNSYLESEIISVDTITIALRDEEYVQDGLDALQELIEVDDNMIYECVDNMFYVGHDIVINLLHAYKRSEIEELVDEIITAIDDVCDFGWDGSAVKMVHFD